MKLNQINALSFYNTWIRFIEEEIIQKGKQELWQNNLEWTNDTIGLKQSGINDSPFGEFLTTKYHGWKYRKEDALVDLSVYWPEYLQDVMNLYPQGHSDYRAGLKVLITYNWDENGGDYAYVLDTLSENFRKIIREANKRNPETGVEYLLIVGQKKADNNITWDKFIFKSPGWEVTR